MAGDGASVPVRVDTRDFVGRDYGHRTALFGKTRMGKSNAVKVIADTILSSDLKAGQIIFDPSGEYTYYNAQDKTSLYSMHASKCVRYSLAPREIASEQRRGFDRPRNLRINFFEAIPAGHSLIQQLWDTENHSRPKYVEPILNWSPPDLEDEPQPTEFSAYNHFWRTMSMWFALLKLAGFSTKPGATARVEFPKKVKEALKDKLGNAVNDTGGGFAPYQRVEVS
jgi:hypothetical protein